MCESYRKEDQELSNEPQNTGSNGMPEETRLTLPVESNQLGSFLSGLLGQPQTLEQSFYQSFDINHDWLLNLHELINQRIHQQASAELLAFRAIVYLENQMKRTLTTIDAFQTYQELQQQVSYGVQLEWSYLVKFPNSDVPEKQQISFSAYTGLRDKSAVRYDKDPFAQLINPSLNPSRARISYRIDYTERTWGNDLEALMSDTITSVVRPEFRKRHYSYMQIGLIFLLIACSMFIANEVFNYMEQIWLAEVRQGLAELKQLAPVTLDTLDAKLLRIGEFTLAGMPVSKASYGIYFLAFMIAMALAPITMAVTDYSLHSFVVLTKPAEVRREGRIKREKRNVLTLIGGYISAIVCSIIAGFVFNYLV